jgi:uncharacterized membrane protein YedE/YeeE
MMDSLLAPWPWYVAGPLIGLVVPLLLLLVGKSFGVSSSFRHLCSICLPGSKLDYLRSNDWRAESWDLLFAVGVIIGAGIAVFFLSSSPVELLPESYSNRRGALLLLVGGILVGFGTRYADGCTSGHSIMGMSSLNWPSLVATISFFAGGLFVVHIIL